MRFKIRTRFALLQPLAHTLDRRRSARKREKLHMSFKFAQKQKGHKSNDVRFPLNPHRGRRRMRAANRCVCEVLRERSHRQEQNRRMRTVQNFPQGNVTPKPSNPKHQTPNPKPPSACRSSYRGKPACGFDPRERPCHTPARGRLPPVDVSPPAPYFSPGTNANPTSTGKRLL